MSQMNEDISESILSEYILYKQLKIMVRLQKIAYQQLVNNVALGRSRVMSAPKKWNAVNHMDHTRKLIHQAFNHSIIGKIIKPFTTFFMNIQRKIEREYDLQRGLAWQDTKLHHDNQLRRNVMFEHMARQALHPYHWILKMRRRQRYYKVDRGIRGFYVPQYIRNEAASQTLVDCQRLQKEWWAFTHDNYYSDFTPSARRTATPKFTVIELLMNYGVTKPDAYSRYFMNETDTMWYSEQELKVVKDRKRFPFDLTTSQGKTRFQDYVNNINKKTPGVVATQGQQFDFKKYYAQIGV